MYSIVHVYVCVYMCICVCIIMHIMYVCVCVHMHGCVYIMCLCVCDIPTCQTQKMGQKRDINFLKNFAKMARNRNIRGKESGQALVYA